MDEDGKDASVTTAPSRIGKGLDLEARRALAEKIVVALREIGLACELIAAEAARDASPETDQRRALIRDLPRTCRGDAET
jgi:hypothetical protein